MIAFMFRCSDIFLRMRSICSIIWINNWMTAFTSYQELYPRTKIVFFSLVKHENSVGELAMCIRTLHMWIRSMEQWLLSDNDMIMIISAFIPLHAKLLQREQKHLFTFYVMYPHWHDTGSWNPSSSKTRTYLFYIVNIMGADGLATEGARVSATIILTMLNQINSVPARQGLIEYCLYMRYL